MDTCHQVLIMASASSAKAEASQTEAIDLSSAIPIGSSSLMAGGVMTHQKDQCFSECALQKYCVDVFQELL